MAKKNKNKLNSAQENTNSSNTENTSTPQNSSTPAKAPEVSRSMPAWQRILIVLLILLLAGLGWWFWSNQNRSNSNNNSDNTTQEAANTSSNANSSDPSASIPTPTTTPTSGNTETNPVNTSNQNTTSGNNVVVSGESYTYTASRGDSLTLFVRRSMLDYAKTNNIELNNNQKMFVETRLTQTLGNFRLRVGQNVQILKSDLKNWVDQAKNLTPAQQAPWARYAALVRY